MGDHPDPSLVVVAACRGLFTVGRELEGAEGGARNGFVLRRDGGSLLPAQHRHGSGQWQARPRRGVWNPSEVVFASSFDCTVTASLAFSTLYGIAVPAFA